LLTRIAPTLFVLLWSSGFIGSKLGAADAEPFTFLAVRFVVVLAVLVPMSLLMGSRMQTWSQRSHALVAGTMIHGAYLGGVFWAIRNGMPAGVVALIVCLQPIATSLLAGPLLGEKLTARHWNGSGLGLAGALLLFSPRLAAAADTATGMTGPTLAAAVVALAGITCGTLYQKRYAAGTPILAGTVWQFIGALLLLGALS
ncbi:unnamed protein product, partial [Phaeothamnion confervicola]